MSLLAARISVSNLHKSTPNKFTETVEKLNSYVLPQSGERSPLISDEVYNIVMAVSGRLSTKLRSELFFWCPKASWCPKFGYGLLSPCLRFCFALFCRNDGQEGLSFL